MKYFKDDEKVLVRIGNCCTYASIHVAAQSFPKDLQREKKARKKLKQQAAENKKRAEKKASSRI